MALSREDPIDAQNWRRLAFAGRYGSLNPLYGMKLTGSDLNAYNHELNRILEEENKKTGD